MSALLLLALAGCSGPADGFEHFPAEGTISLDGKPLDSGTINFIPAASGASSSGEIKAGAFRLDGAAGLSPGAYRVEIYSIRPTGKKVASPDEPGTLVDETNNVVPKRYNIDSTLTTEIPPGGPKAPLSFTLTGASKGKAG